MYLIRLKTKYKTITCTSLFFPYDPALAGTVIQCAVWSTSGGLLANVLSVLGVGERK